MISPIALISYLRLRSTRRIMCGRLRTFRPTKVMLRSWRHESPLLGYTRRGRGRTIDPMSVGWRWRIMPLLRRNIMMFGAERPWMDCYRQRTISRRSGMIITRIRTPCLPRIHPHRNRMRLWSPAWSIHPTRTTIMHPDHAARPVAVVVEPVANAEPKAKTNKRSRPCAAHPEDFRIVAWNINNLRIGWHDVDDLVFRNDPLLRRIL